MRDESQGLRDDHSIVEQVSWGMRDVSWGMRDERWMWVEGWEMWVEGWEMRDDSWELKELRVNGRDKSLKKRWDKK